MIVFALGLGTNLLERLVYINHSCFDFLFAFIDVYVIYQLLRMSLVCLGMSRK